MTESPSTPRLRATFAIYLALVGATAVVGPSEIGVGWHWMAGIAGFICVAIACLGRIWCSAYIAGHKDEVLVTTGPYARCRHPLYALSMLGALGLGLTTRSPLLCMVVVVLIAALVVYAAAGEEQFLADAFPEEFKNYVGAVPNKWWPSFEQPRSLTRLSILTAVYWKAFLDAGSFFLLWLMVAIAAEFRVIPLF